MINKLFAELSAIEQVEAISLGGSRSGENYDEKSDYDVYLYITAPVAEEIRRSILGKYCQYMEIGNHYWEYEDNCVLNNGIDIDILYRDLDDFCQDVADVVELCHPRNGYTTCMWHNLLTCRIIYDKKVTTTGTNNTLVLQSYDGEKVPVVLEFENKTGNAFTGKDGIIYPDTKFYLIAQLDPAGKGEGDCAGRVFTQDFTTTVTMKIESLANAYSCMPDLLSPRLEIGVQVVTQWILSTPTIVKL